MAASWLAGVCGIAASGSGASSCARLWHPSLISPELTGCHTSCLWRLTCGGVAKSSTEPNPKAGLAFKLVHPCACGVGAIKI